jgi:hypothetical protein
MEWFDFFALTLAGGGILEAWFKGDLFATARAVMQAKDTQFWDPAPPMRSSATAAEEEQRQPLWLRLFDLVPNFCGAVLSCVFCLSYHAPFWLGLALWVPSLWLPEPWNLAIRFPIYSLAATRAGNILTGLLPPGLQYEDHDERTEQPTSVS